MPAPSAVAVTMPPVTQRVLIVDDDAAIRETTGEYLSEHGFEVAFAADGEQMRAVFSNAGPAGFPDIVLLDLNLPGEDGQAGRKVKVGRCTLDLDTHQLSDPDGRELPITGMEFDLLRVFIDNANRVLSRDQLLNLTRNREWEPFDRSIDIRIARLRRKIEANPGKPAAIRTVRGAGYMFVSG